MTEQFTVDSDGLRALAAAWDDVVSAIADNPGPDLVARCPANLAGSHTAWVCSQTAVHMAQDLTDAVRRITAIVGAATTTSTSYDGVDGTQAATYSAPAPSAVR